MISYQVLGPLAVRAGGIDCTPRGPKVGKVLALLVLRGNEVVGLPGLVEELWEQRPPRTAVTTVRTHVYHLRRALDGAAPEAAAALVTEPTGYRLRVGPGELDADRFAAAVERGRLLLAAGDAEGARTVLHPALAAWRGPALANLDPGPVLARHAEHLRELRIAALELRIEADLAVGRYRQLVPELRGLVAAHPLHEWFHARLIEALRRCGRRGEALHAYRDLRAVLDRELGLEPSLDLQRLQLDLLRSGSPERVAS